MMPSMIALAAHMSRQRAEGEVEQGAATDEAVPAQTRELPEQRTFYVLRAVTALLATDVARARALLDELSELLRATQQRLDGLEAPLRDNRTKPSRSP
jgi:hypothetical protein